MSAFALKMNAARATAAWQLALDKFPFDSERPETPHLSRPDHRGQEQNIKPHRLREIRQRAGAAAPEWKVAIQGQFRFLRAVEARHGSRFRQVTLVNSSRLLLHLGRSSVLENVGLYCERVTGLPVIPGPAVKGVLSTWACWSEHFDETAGGFREITEESASRRRFTGAGSSLAARIFGDNSPGGSTAAGEIIFLGAVPVTPPVLELDIVTPHTDAVGRDRSPVPNPFLAIAPGTEWRFSFLARPRDDSAPAPLLDQCAGWLSECLEQSGLGAKTAAGHGRFLSPDSWRNLTLDPKKKEKEDILKANLEKIRADAVGDYPNEASFTNAVINRLDRPGEYQSLQAEVRKIEDNPANHPWIEKITAALRGNKDARKRLKDKDWFPKSWLP